MFVFADEQFPAEYPDIWLTSSSDVVRSSSESNIVAALEYFHSFTMTHRRFIGQAAVAAAAHPVPHA